MGSQRWTDNVEVRFSKWQGTPATSFAAIWLGRDAHGTWLGMPRGTVVTKKGMSAPVPFPSVMLVPHHGSWVARFRREHRYAVYADVTTAAVLSESSLELVDLDIDVVRFRATGEVAVKDEDEFAERRETFGYPAEVVATARKTRSYLTRAITTWAEPFDGAAEPWLSSVAG
jgi:protein associated with RNAse G/E